MKLLFVSRNIPQGMFDKLKYKYDIRLLEPCETLDTPVSSHADMLAGLYDGRLIVTSAYYKKNAVVFRGTEPVITEEEHGKKYPHDVLLNFIDVKTAVIGYEKAITNKVKKPVISVKQGYTRCSTLIGRNFAVSADRGILSALSSLGYDTLLISEGGVELNGYGHGFIGGASFSDGDDVYFFGSLLYHKDGDRIKEFLHLHGAEIHELDCTPLIDLGGAVIINN